MLVALSRLHWEWREFTSISSQYDYMIFASSFMETFPLAQERRRCPDACQTACESTWTRYEHDSMMPVLSTKCYGYAEAWKVFFRLHVEQRCRRNCRYATAHSESVERLSLTVAHNFHTILVWVAGGMRRGWRNTKLQMWMSTTYVIRGSVIIIVIIIIIVCWCFDNCVGVLAISVLVLTVFCIVSFM